MARRRRPGSRTSVADGHAEVIVPLEAIIDANGEPMTFAAIRRWLPTVSSYPASLDAVEAGVAIVLDGFAWDLHLGDVGHATDTHAGEAFLTAAKSDGSIMVYVADDLDPRRAKPDDLDAAARSQRLLGARVGAFTVDVIQP